MSTGLKYCSNCGQQIDVKAEICPKCGVRVSPVQVPVTAVERKSEGLAAVLSFFIPGLGQVYNGQIGKGIVVFIVFAICSGLMILLIGFILAPLCWVWNVYDAYSTAKKINQRQL